MKLLSKNTNIYIFLVCLSLLFLKGNFVSISKKNLSNGPISLKHNSNPINVYPDYRFSQTAIRETISDKSLAEEGGDKPVFTLNIHAPQESTEDIIDSIKDLKQLVNDERKAADDDFLVEKKKLVEAQRIRIRDIVHGSFEAVNSLIPNPIKSAIRNSLHPKENQK